MADEVMAPHVALNRVVFSIQEMAKAKGIDVSDTAPGGLSINLRILSRSLEDLEARVRRLEQPAPFPKFEKKG